MAIAAPDVFSRVTDERLSLDGMMSAVSNPTHGAIATYLGRVRGSESGRTIRSITYEAYTNMADKIIAGIAAEAEARWPVKAAARHRVGKIPAGEPCLAVVCAGVHRKEAFAACQFIVDQIKASAPIRKIRFE